MWQSVEQPQQLSATAHVNSIMVDVVTGVLAHLTNAGVYTVSIQHETSRCTCCSVAVTDSRRASRTPSRGQLRAYNLAAAGVASLEQYLVCVRCLCEVTTSSCCTKYELVNMSISMHDLTSRSSL